MPKYQILVLILKKLGQSVLRCFSYVPFHVKLMLQALLGEQGALLGGDVGVEANGHLLAVLIDLSGMRWPLVY